MEIPMHLKKHDEAITIDFITNPTVLGVMVQKTKNVIYQEKLGTLYDKTLRMMALTEYICKKLNK